MTDTVDNRLLLALLQEIRKEQKDQRTLLLQTVEYMRRMESRLDARIAHLRDDLELMIKAELMGRLTHFETALEQRIDAMSDRLAEIETRG